MNYEDMSDHKINCLVDTQLFISGDGQPKMFNLDNPADWGRLIQDNKISCNWWVDEEGGNNDCWEASTSTRWENSRHKTSPGRAVSICYLKSKEAE